MLLPPTTFLMTFCVLTGESKIYKISKGGVLILFKWIQSEIP